MRCTRHDASSAEGGLPKGPAFPRIFQSFVIKLLQNIGLSITLLLAISPVNPPARSAASKGRKGSDDHRFPPYVAEWAA